MVSHPLDGALRFSSTDSRDSFLSSYARATTQTGLIGSLSVQITEASRASADHQSSLLRYQIERDEAVAEAANKVVQPSSSNTWGNTRSSAANDDWDMSGGGGKSGGAGGLKSGGKKWVHPSSQLCRVSLQRNTLTDRSRVSLMGRPLATHGSPAHARKKNKT